MENREVKFFPGERIKSARSGRIWIVSNTEQAPPPLLEGCIPVRKENWATTQFCWQRPDTFEEYHLRLV